MARAGSETTAAAEPDTEPAGRVLRRLVVVVACVLSALLGARALLTIDPYYDTFAYHLPFAARVIGLCPSSCYRMGELLETRFAAFPKAFEVLQGAVWWLAGTPQVVDVLNLAFLAAFAFFLRRVFAVPFAWILVGLVAVPLIQSHVTAVTSTCRSTSPSPSPFSPPWTWCGAGESSVGVRSRWSSPAWRSRPTASSR